LSEAAPPEGLEREPDETRSDWLDLSPIGSNPLMQKCISKVVGSVGWTFTLRQAKEAFEQGVNFGLIARLSGLFKRGLSFWSRQRLQNLVHAA
jgi:hypothetical protein